MLAASTRASPQSRVAIDARLERWPIRGSFRISRGGRTEAEVVVVAIHRDGLVGRGEAVPYARYGETAEQVLAAVRGLSPDVSHPQLAELLPPGAARSAVDCALWDLAARASGRRVWELLGVPAPSPVTTAWTISLDSPEAMARATAQRPGATLLKVKVGAEAVVERLEAVREAAPAARLIVDANEAWSVGTLADLAPELARLGVELVEQPVPAAEDHGLAGLDLGVTLCADEACHTVGDLERARERYQAVNVKADKAGGLTGAAELALAARGAGLRVMLGCMVSTSLAIAPAMALAALADVVDLDGALLLARDREPGLRYEGLVVHPPDAAFWG